MVLKRVADAYLDAPHQVRVVEHKATKKTYALKYVDKARCIRQKVRFPLSDSSSTKLIVLHDV